MKIERSDVPARLAASVAGDLREYGVDLDVVAADVVYVPTFSAQAALNAVRHEGAGRTVVVGDRIHGRVADVLRGADVWFIDGAGNAYIRAPGLVVDVRGRRAEAPQDEASDESASHAVNLLSPRRAQVAMALLADPDLADAAYRVLARHAGVSVGMAKNAMDALASAGFIEQVAGRRRLVRAATLLDAWAAAYPQGLRRSTLLLTASGALTDWAAPPGTTVATSGEAAVPRRIRHPESLVLYVQPTEEGGVPPELMVASRWHRDQFGNIVIHKLFWQALPGIDGDGSPPAVLVYADLLASGESRQREVAGELRESDARLSQL